MKKIVAAKLSLLFLLVIIRMPLLAENQSPCKEGEQFPCKGIEEIENLDETQMKLDWEELKSAMQRYAQLIPSGKIPGIKPNETGWKTEFIKLTPRYLSLSTEFEAKQFQEEIHACSNLFKVDARKETKTIRVFLCKKKEKIELMSVYFFEGNKWRKIK